MILAAFAVDFIMQDRHLILFWISLLGALPTGLQTLKATMERRISIDTFNFIALMASFTAVEIPSAAFIILMITCADLLEWYSESRTFDAVQHLLKLKPLSALRELDGKIEEVPSSEIKSGDIVVVKTGARVPIDGVVVFGSASVNEAPVTGESVPVQKIVGDQVFTGTLNDSGALKVRATKVGKDSIIEQMAILMQEASKNKSKAEKLADRFASIFLPIVLLIAGVTYYITKNISMTASIFLVACADDMAVAVPLAITASMGQAAKRGVIVKGGVWLDNLGKIKTLVLDKTGTLTYGSFEIREVYVEPDILEKDFWNYLGIAEKFSEHPIGRAIFREALKHNLDIPDPEEFTAIKSSGTKAVFEKNIILSGTEKLFKAENILISEKILQSLPRMIEQYGQTVSLVAVNGRCIGVIAVADVPRTDAAKTMAKLKEIGVDQIIMFTGDNEAVAKRVSATLGIDSYKAGMKPEEKLRGLEELEEQGVVVMVGDGINDAPSLARAGVGIAMGKGGTAVAVEAADIVILTDELSRLPEMIELGRRTSSVIYGDMVIWLLSNIVGFALVLTGVAGPALAAFYNFITDFFPLANSSRLFRSKIKLLYYAKC